MQAYKNISRPCVGAEAYVAIIGVLAGKVVALYGLDLAAGGRQIAAYQRAYITRYISLGNAIATIDSAGVDARMMSGV